MRLPALGALGSMSLAGASRRADQQALRVGTRVTTRAAPEAMAATGQFTGVRVWGMSYMMA